MHELTKTSVQCSYGALSWAATPQLSNSLPPCEFSVAFLKFAVTSSKTNHRSYHSLKKNLIQEFRKTFLLLKIFLLARTPCQECEKWIVVLVFCCLLHLHWAVLLGARWRRNFLPAPRGLSLLPRLSFLFFSVFKCQDDAHSIC